MTVPAFLNHQMTSNVHIPLAGPDLTPPGPWVRVKFHYTETYELCLRPEKQSIYVEI